MAQGFIVPLDEGQRVEDAAEEYFSILLRRCFFQEVKCDDYGGILACKIHDLMHDMAQNLAGKEICVTNSVVNNVGEKVRHLSLMRGRSAQHSFTKTHIRSYLFVGGWSVNTKMQQQSVESLVAKWVYLRALDLSESGMTSLPDSIGKLLHLRFLDLSRNAYLEVLPKSITKLYNLETLKLTRCSSLIELPNDLSKLVKLRALDVKQCNRLTRMPRGIGKLSCLHALNRFVASSPSWKKLFDELEELIDLNNLKGELSIEITFPHKCNEPEVNEGDRMKGAYLRNKEHLNVITFHFSGASGEEGDDEEALRLIEEVQPHSNLKGLELCGYVVARMPSWARGNNLSTFLPNLIRLQLSNLSIKDVTCLGDLLLLKALKIEFLSELENIIEYSEPTTSTSTLAAAGLKMSTAERPSLFPSLERLELIFLSKLEGWRRSRMGVGDKDELLHDSSRSMEPLLLPQLKTLRIKSCPNLESILLCPVLEELKLQKYNKKRLQILTPLPLPLSKELGDKKAEAASLSYINSGISWKITIRDVDLLKLLPMEDLQCLYSVNIVGDKEVESLGEVGEVIFSSMTFLRYLAIESCSNLRSVSGGGLEHLASLEDLKIQECPNLSLAEEVRQDGIDIGIPWQSLSHSLRRLTLAKLPQLVDLPNQIQFLAALQILEIDNCQGLESLPNWMPKLTSLRQFRLWFCSACLRERCQDSTGEDWPHIKHIPSIEFQCCFY